MATSSFKGISPSRPNYFPGQYLLETDFEDQLQYLVSRQRYQQQSLYVAGVVEGLVVSPVAGKKQVTVSAGTAIAPDGSLIALSEAQTVNPINLEDTKVNAQGVSTGDLYIQFGSVPDLDTKQEKDNDESFNRYIEAPEIKFDAATPAGAVTLARLTLSTTAVNPPDLSTRKASGVRLPSRGGNLSLRYQGDWGDPGTAPEMALLSGSLSVTGKVGIGTTPAEARLDVAGASDTAGQISLQLRSGNTNANYNSNQLTFGYANTGQYRHAIKTRHNGNARSGNALDFYVWKWLSATDKDQLDTVGTLHTMTLDGGNVGVGITNPQRLLEVGPSSAAGTGQISSSSTTVTGTNTGTNATQFLSQLRVGDFIIATYTPTSGTSVTRFRKVTAITSDTSLTTETAFDPAIPANTTFRFSRPALQVNGATRLGHTSVDYNAHTVLSVAPGTVQFDGPNSVGGRLHIDGASGNVGIGTTNPREKLDIGSFSTAASDIYLGIKTLGGNQYKAGIKLSHWRENYGIKLESDETTRLFRISGGDGEREKDYLCIRCVGHYNEGNVGIGIADPVGKLQIVNTSQDANGATLILGPTNSSNLRLGYHNDYSWIQSHGDKTLWINPIGNNVGIGTTTIPTEKLEVNGNIKAINATLTGTLTVTPVLTANDNNATLSAVVINPTFNDNGKTGVKKYGLSVNNLHVTGVMTGTANDYQKAQFTMSGGGIVSWSWNASTNTGRLKWTQRFIAISMERSTTFSAGHVNITQPTTDTAIQAYDSSLRSGTSAEGILLKEWDALYAIHTVGGNENAVTFQIVRYTTTTGFQAPSNWILVAVVNKDNGTVKLGTGVILQANSSSDNLNFGSSMRQMINLYDTSYGIGIQTSTQYFRTATNFAWYKGGAHTDTELSAGTVGTVDGTVQMVIKDGNVGIDTHDPKQKFVLSSGKAGIGYNDTAQTATLAINGNVGICTTTPLGNLTIMPYSYQIDIQGSGMESSEGNTNDVKVNGISVMLPQWRSSGINTIILRPNGTVRANQQHSVYHGGSTQWDVWATWVDTTALDGDAVAVTSNDAIKPVPSTGFARTLLQSVGATQILDVTTEDAAFRLPYALLFMKGQKTGAREVKTSKTGANARISVQYHEIGGNTRSRVGIGYNETAQTAALAVNGNVGIGTTVPSAKLEVNGNIKLVFDCVHVDGNNSWINKGHPVREYLLNNLKDKPVGTYVRVISNYSANSYFEGWVNNDRKVIACHKRDGLTYDLSGDSGVVA